MTYTVNSCINYRFAIVPYGELECTIYSVRPYLGRIGTSVYSFVIGDDIANPEAQVLAILDKDRLVYNDQEYYYVSYRESKNDSITQTLLFLYDQSIYDHTT